MSLEPIQDLAVTVNRVCYPADTVENATWFILDTDHGTCKGSMNWRPRAKERLVLRGRFGQYQGRREFKFTSAALNVPTDSRGLLHYVCEMANGIGPAMETQIWEKLGERWSELTDTDIPRLKGTKYESFCKAMELVEQDRGKGQVIAELLKAGASMNMATAAFQKWETETLGVVRADPYRLAELPNYGFCHVDTDIRLYYGIADDDPRRIRAALVYVIRQMTSSGSTVVTWSELLEAGIKQLGGMGKLIGEQVSAMFEEGTLKGFTQTQSIALASDFRNELEIWNFLTGDPF
ncbi:MAG: helix-hairpin-helix domain-containing protein [Verrucomicrobiota bacterium]